MVNKYYIQVASHKSWSPNTKYGVNEDSMSAENEWYMGAITTVITQKIIMTKDLYCRSFWGIPLIHMLHE